MVVVDINARTNSGCAGTASHESPNLNRPVHPIGERAAVQAIRDSLYQTVLGVLFRLLQITHT